MSGSVRSCETAACSSEMVIARLEAAGGNATLGACDSREYVRRSDLSTPPLGDTECGSHSENQGLIKLATKRGGARAGAGRKAKGGRQRNGGGERWYCIQVQPRGELAVIHALTLKGFRVHCPLIRLDVGAVPAMRFPGYLFVEFDREGVAWRAIPTTERVVKLFSSSAETPSPLRRGYVEGLLAEAGASGFVDAVGDGPGDLDVGEEVRLLDGPLAGLVGRVATASTNWVEVKVGLFGRETPVWAARRGVERVG